MKTTGIVLVIILIIAILGLGIFFITKNASQGNANNNPATNTGTAANSQLDALVSNSDSSEPSDVAATTDTSVVDSTGLS